MTPNTPISLLELCLPVAVHSPSFYIYLQVEAIRAYEGDVAKLGNAEKFYRELIALPEYGLRLETMIVMTEFDSITESIRSNLKLYEKAISATMQSQSLDDFLRLVLQLGNFINTVSNSHPNLL